MKIDQIDLRMLMILQRDGNLPQRELADRVGLSQNACWRRLKRLEQCGIIAGSRVILAREQLGMDLTVFMMIRTRHHSREWSDRFREHVASIPEIAEFHRIGGEWDYLARIVTTSMSGYDQVYQKLIDGFDLENVTGYFLMETIFEGRPLALLPRNGRQ